MQPDSYQPAPHAATLRQTGREVYSPREVARAVGLCPATVYEAIHRGELKASRVGRRFLVPRSEVRRLLGLERYAA